MPPPAERPAAGRGSHGERSTPAPSLDRPVFWLAVLAVVGVCLPLGLLPEQAGPIVTAAYDWTALNLGLFYQWFAIGVIIFLIWLALGRHGNVRLGDADDRPEFSTFSWAGMLFCAGVGAGLLYWASIEWVAYYEKPPMGVVPRSTAAHSTASVERGTTPIGGCS